MDGSERLTALFQLCKLFIQSGKWDQADVIYDLCIKEFENDFRCYFNHAQLRCLQKRYAEALSLFYEAEIRYAAHIIVPSLCVMTAFREDNVVWFIALRNQDEIIIVTALSGLLLKLREPQKAQAYCRKVSFYIVGYDLDYALPLIKLNVSLHHINQISGIAHKHLWRYIMV